jgi:hypothetical protein
MVAWHGRPDSRHNAHRGRNAPATSGLIKKRKLQIISKLPSPPQSFLVISWGGGGRVGGGGRNFLDFFIYVIQQSFSCRTSDFTVSEIAGIEPRTVATLALTARRSNHSTISHLL